MTKNKKKYEIEINIKNKQTMEKCHFEYVAHEIQIPHYQSIKGTIPKFKKKILVISLAHREIYICTSIYIERIYICMYVCDPFIRFLFQVLFIQQIIVLIVFVNMFFAGELDNANLGKFQTDTIF